MDTKMPQVRRYMTRTPITVPETTPLADAEKLMREHRIRHVPVTQGTNVVGILSERNAQAVLFSKHGEAYTAKDAMIPEPFVTFADADLAEVAQQMADGKYGSCIIQNEQHQVEGIFTTVDACRALTELLDKFCTE